MVPLPLMENSRSLESVHVLCDMCGRDVTDTLFTLQDLEFATSSDNWRMVCCLHCGLIYLNPRPTSAMLPAIYPPLSYGCFTLERDLTRLSRWGRDWREIGRVRSIVSLLGSRSARVLDVGCGTGIFLHLLAERGSRQWRVEGVEVAEEAVRLAREKGLLIHQGLFETLPLDPEAYDLVTMNHVIEHLPVPSKVFEKVWDILKPGGYFLVETPTHEAWDARLMGKAWGGWHVPRHWTIFSARTLRLMGEAHGLRVLRTDYLLSPAFWVIGLGNLLKLWGVPRALANKFYTNNTLLILAASLVDWGQRLLTGRTSNMRMVFERQFSGRIMDGHGTGAEVSGLSRTERQRAEERLKLSVCRTTVWPGSVEWALGVWMLSTWALYLWTMRVSAWSYVVSLRERFLANG